MACHTKLGLPKQLKFLGLMSQIFRSFIGSPQIWFFPIEMRAQGDAIPRRLRELNGTADTPPHPYEDLWIAPPL